MGSDTRTTHMGTETAQSNNISRCALLFSTQGRLQVDYGEPSGLCSEIRPGVFRRNYSKATVEMDCARWKGSIEMKDAQTVLQV